MGQQELLREYRRASALCMPSRLLPDDRDGIPNVLVEAMAAGTPVIASAVSGIPELVEHEVNGLLVEPEDPEALADTLVRLHGDPRSRARSPSTAARRSPALRRPDARRPPGRAVQGASDVTSAVARRPRPVLCMTEHEHRSRAIADAVARRALHGRGRDAHARHRSRLAQRRPPAGRGVADRVGQVRVGARPRARRPPGAWEGLTASWIRQCAPDEDAAEVTARRILNWIYAWQRFEPARRARRAAVRQPRATRSSTSAPTSRPRATTARSSSTRC